MKIERTRNYREIFYKSKFMFLLNRIYEDYILHIVLYNSKRLMVVPRNARLNLKYILFGFKKTLIFFHRAKKYRPALNFIQHVKNKNSRDIRVCSYF